MVTLDPINVNEPRAKRTYTYNEDDIKAIAKEGLEETLEFEAASGAKYKVFENIVDKDGHPRFIEGDINLSSEVENKYTKEYGKWSLSGTHLMIVLACSVLKDVVMSGSEEIAVITLPDYIANKIRPIQGYTITYTSITAWDSSFNVQSFQIRSRIQGNKLYLFQSNVITFTQDRTFRYALDLLIDNE